MEVGLFLGIGFIALMSLSLYVTGYFASKAKRDLQCIAFASHEIQRKILEELDTQKIYYSTMLWSPGQSSYSQLGSAQRTPAEIWITKSDLATVKKLIAKKYMIEEIETALVIHEKSE